MLSLRTSSGPPQAKLRRAGQALIGARRWADEIPQVSPMSVRASKQAVYLGLEQGGVAGAEGVRYSAVADMVASQDYIEGPRAFAEKRRPNWTGA